WDTVSVPPGVMRGFRNAGSAEAYLMAILGGTDAGHVSWAPQVLERARDTGLALDGEGNLLIGGQKEPPRERGRRPGSYIGARVKRGDDPRLLTGRGRYVDDLTLPRMVHVAFMRSAHAHARLTRVGLDSARRAPGVIGLLTGEDARHLCKPYRGVLLHYKGMKTGAMLPAALGRRRYVGEPTVARAAESRAAAEDAAALVDVEYEALPPLLTPAEALAPGAPLIHQELGDNLLYETRIAAGDPDGA